MPAYLSPIGNEQQADANGAPVSGALINTYLAGTTTPVTTYTDAAGLVPQANPVVCNSAGRPASPIFLPAGVAVKMVFTTSVASGSVAYRPAVDNIQGVNDPSFATTVSEWTGYSGTPSFISATSFSVTGDQTNTFQVGRRVKSTNTGGTVYSTILTSSFAATITTVTVVNSSGVLDAGLSAVSYGLLASLNPSSPPPNRAYAEYTTNADLTALIPFDDTIPQITEGTQILAASITPKSTTSRVRVRFQGWGYVTGAGDGYTSALFLNGAANAVATGFSGLAYVAAVSAGPCVVEFEYVPGTTSAQAFTLRVGGVASTIRLNGTTTGRRFGGTSRATLVVEELAA